MEQKTDRLYPSAPLENDINLERRLEQKINDVNSFNNSINNIKATAVRLNVIKLDVVAIITNVSTDFSIVVIVLYFLYFFFDLLFLSLK